MIDLAGPFLAAFATLTQLVVVLGIVAVFAAIVIATWSLVHTVGSGPRGPK